MDHNERAQAVQGLDQAEILEIIDHHRLADIQTTQPIRVRNEPVGSTNTIITEMYQEHGVMPSPAMAGLMAAAILSDTVMFKSPTCTKRDVAMAERMARIANVSLNELGRSSSSTAASTANPPKICCTATSRSSTLLSRIWVWGRSPAWIPRICSSAGRSFWRPCATIRRSTTTTW